MQPCTLPMDCLMHPKMELGIHVPSRGLELGDICPTEDLDLHSFNPCPIPCDVGHTSARGWANGRGAVGLGEQSLMAHPGSAVLSSTELACHGLAVEKPSGHWQKRIRLQTFHPQTTTQKSATKNTPIGRQQHNTSPDDRCPSRGYRTPTRNILWPKKN